MTIFMIFYKTIVKQISYQSKRVYVGILYKNLIKFSCFWGNIVYRRIAPRSDKLYQPLP
jgi:hypothetical protein